MLLEIILYCIYASIYLCSSEGTLNLLENVSLPAVFTFGDSNFDQGNNNYIVTLSKANFPPYGKDFVDRKPTGRFSNGKSLPDFFVKALGVKEYLPAYLDPSIQDQDFQTGVSFASGGSGFDPLTPKITSAIPLSGQLEMFKQYIRKLKKTTGEEVAHNIITESVYLISASSNDLLVSYTTVRRFQYNVPTYDNMLVKLAVNFIQEIHKLGARKIVVLSAPPTGCLPSQRTLAGGAHRECVKKENEAAQLFNNMLKQQLHFLASNLLRSRVVFVDVYNPVMRIIENPHKYGFEVTDKGCCGTGDMEVVFLCNKISPMCQDASKFFFWDSFHVSEKGCNIVVNEVLHILVKGLF